MSTIKQLLEHAHREAIELFQEERASLDGDLARSGDLTSSRRWISYQKLCRKTLKTAFSNSFDTLVQHDRRTFFSKKKTIGLAREFLDKVSSDVRREYEKRAEKAAFFGGSQLKFPTSEISLEVDALIARLEHEIEKNDTKSKIVNSFNSLPQILFDRILTLAIGMIFASAAWNLKHLEKWASNLFGT